MYQFFLICATLGGTILILRVALSLLGVGFDSLDGDLGDADADAGSGDDASVDHTDGGHLDLGRWLTFQALVSFLAFFGVGGLTALDAKQAAPVAVVVGLVTGLVAVILLGYVLRAVRKLNTDGTVRIEQAVGLEAKVYLRIPANGLGEGKITLPIQGRTIEVLAQTAGPALAGGEPVLVSRVINERIVEVVLAQPRISKPAPLAELAE